MVIKKYIKGGLNSDVNPSLVPDGDYLNALNIRGQIGDDGKAGVIRPVPGHTKISNIANDRTVALETSTQDVKHMCVDEVNGYAYAFISGSVDVSLSQTVPPKIIRTDLKSGLSEDIFLSSSVSDNWEPDGDSTYLWDDLVEAKVSQDTLVWINKFGYQFSLNVKAYLNQTAGTPKFNNQTVDRRDISLIKAPPAFNLEIQKIEDLTYTGVNYIKDNAFQFAYRYVYVGYEQSVVSPWSIEVPLNFEDEDFNGVNISVPTNEVIPVSLLYLDIISKNNLTGALNLIKRYSSLNSNDLSSIDLHNQGEVQLSFKFHNDNIYESIDNAYFIKPFDSLPIKSNCIEVSKDRLFLGNNIEGYDTPEYIDISVDVTAGQLTGSKQIDYNNQLWEGTVEHNVYVDGRDEDPETEYWSYERNIMYITGIPTPGWFLCNALITTSPTSSSKISSNSFFLVSSSAPPSSYYKYEIRTNSGSGIDFTSLTLPPNCEIYVNGFSNPNNNGFYVIDSVISATRLRVIKADTVLPTAASAGPTVSIQLISARYTQGVPPDALPSPADDDIANLISITSPNEILSRNYIRNIAEENVAWESVIYGDYELSGPDNDVEISGLDSNQGRTFKSSSRYNLGIQFYDFAMRRCGVVTRTRNNQNQLIDISASTPRRLYDDSNLEMQISWSLNSGTQLNIPIWAKYYSIVRTDNLDTRYFIQGRTTALASGNMVSYATKSTTGYTISPTSNSFNGATTAAIALDISNIISESFGYIYEQDNNDTVILYADSGDFFTLSVIGQQDKYILLEPKNIGSPTISDIYIYEIRRPYRITSQESFYEGAVYSINNWGTNTRSFSQLSGTLGGDTFIFDSREFMNLRSEFRNIWLRNLGRACFIDPIGQVYKPNGIRWSNTFVPGSKLNGLSSFDAIDFKDVPVELGPINKLKTTSKAQSDGNIMLAIGQNYTASMYIGETSFVDNAGQSLLATSGAVIGTINVLRGRFGTTIPSSVVEYDGNVYWADILNECIVRYAANGLFAISDYGMRNFFRSYFKSKKTQVDEYDITQSPYIYGGYNPATDEYILSFEPTSESPSQYPDSSSNKHSDISIMYKTGTPAKSVGFSLSQERWASFYSHSGPYVTFGGKMYSFVKSVYNNTATPVIAGGLFEFKKDSDINSFSGSTKNSFISIPFNEAPNNVKIFQSVSVEGTTAPTTTYVETLVPNSQITNLVEADFTNREDMLYSEIYRDRVSPNVSGAADEKMYTGDKMRGQYANISMVWENPSNFETRFINANVKDSIGHTKLSK